MYNMVLRRQSLILDQWFLAIEPVRSPGTKKDALNGRQKYQLKYIIFVDVRFVSNIN